MKAILSLFLTLSARLYLWRFKPSIVAVTGNAGKTTTKEAIAAVLATKYRVRATGGNLNNELGTPLTIIGDFSDDYYRTGGTLGFWSKVWLRTKLGFFRPRSSYPEILVLEYGADRPGDIITADGPEIAGLAQVELELEGFWPDTMVAGHPHKNTAVAVGGSGRITPFELQNEIGVLLLSIKIPTGIALADEHAIRLVAPNICGAGAGLFVEGFPSGELAIGPLLFQQ